MERKISKKNLKILLLSKFLPCCREECVSSKFSKCTVCSLPISNLGAGPCDRAFFGSLPLLWVDMLGWVAIGVSLYWTVCGVLLHRMLKPRLLKGDWAVRVSLFL
jgi:hypothetical protein